MKGLDLTVLSGCNLHYYNTFWCMKCNFNTKIDVCETLMPFPIIIRIGLTFGLDLSPTDLNIDRGRLVKDYLRTKF